MGTYRPTRNIKASIIQYLEAELASAWSNVNVEEDFARVYTISLPVICITTGVSSHPKAEIGSDSTVRETSILIDIFATSNVQSSDLTDFLVEKLKGGCVYYNYTITDGAVSSKIADGRIRVKDIDVTPLNLTTPRNTLDPYDRYRNLITLSVGLGKIEI